LERKFKGERKGKGMPQAMASTGIQKKNRARQGGYVGRVEALEK
jgi:hypothetical protein